MDLSLRGAQVEFPNRISNGHVIKSGCLKDYASEKPWTNTLALGDARGVSAFKQHLINH